jgi:N-acetylneuraminic acid mutarotase
MLYISGGKDKTTNKQTNAFYVHSPLTSKLKPLSNMLHPRCSHSMIVINKHLYAVGGYNNNTTEKYSFDINQWCSLPKLNVKERQVSTLFNMNDKYLYCAFGFINGVSCNDVDYAEKLDLNKKDKWRLIPFKVNAACKVDLKRYNVGIVYVKEGEFVILGGENAQNEECDCVFQMKINKIGNEKIEINDMKDKKGGGMLKMPIKCSFIDKEFKEVKKGKVAMFEMKKNRFVVYNYNKGVFKVKEF